MADSNCSELSIDILPCLSTIPSLARFFMDKVARHLFIFEGDGVVRDFQGTFSEYLEYRRDQAKPTVSYNVRRRRAKPNRAYFLSLF